MERANDRIRLCGTVADRPAFSHSARGTAYFTFPLAVRRLSGTEDVLNILATENQLSDLDVAAAPRLFVSGEVRSYNNRSGSGAKLVITVLARELRFTGADYENSVTLTGTLCKEPTLRRTPMGREICDMMLAVNRNYGRSDYLPCISWGSTARAVGQLRVGSEVSLNGRLQSRSYIKVVNDVPVDKTAYEVSVLTLTVNIPR